MNVGTCIVCSATTQDDPDWCNDDYDLCANCKDAVLATFKRAVLTINPKYRIDFVSDFVDVPNKGP